MASPSDTTSRKRPPIHEKGASSSSSSSSSSSEETVSNLLTVPLSFVLAKGARHKRRLLRGEAAQLVRVRLLASETDVLLGATSEVLGRRSLCRRYGAVLAASVTTRHTHDDDDPRRRLDPRAAVRLRALLPLLHAHGEHRCDAKLQQLETELRRCLGCLEDCSTALRQCAEQNLSVAEQLSEMWDDDDDDEEEEETPGRALAREKRVVGEVEEALCGRIDALVAMCREEDEEGEPTADVFEAETDPASGRFVSMAEFCARLQHPPDHTSTTPVDPDVPSTLPPEQGVVRVPIVGTAVATGSSSLTTPTGEEKVEEVVDDDDKHDGSEETTLDANVSESVDDAAVMLSELRRDL